MRNAFADEITKLAKTEEKLFLLSGDIGNKLFDKFKEAAPGRFLNCGVAEANMIGVAAGLSMSGFKPIIYTITPFITSRCFEQIRVDLCYHNVPAILVGTGAGLSYATLGPTHHSCEDIAILRSIPNMKVVCPADAHEVRAVVREAVNHEGPIYIRLGKKGEPLVHQDIPPLEIGRGIILQEGKDLCLISTGNMLPTSREVADRLKGRGLSVGIVSMHSIKPLDHEALEKIFSRYNTVVSIEEHSLIGGLGSAIAEWFVDHQQRAGQFIRIGTPDQFMDVVGEQEFARKYFNISPEQIEETIMRRMGSKTLQQAVEYTHQQSK